MFLKEKLKFPKSSWLLKKSSSVYNPKLDLENPPGL